MPSSVRILVVLAAVLGVLPLPGVVHPFGDSYVDGQARLVAVETLVPEVCTWPGAGAAPEPAAFAASVPAAVFAQGAPAPSSRRTGDLSQRPPLRTIRDPYPAFSAIAMNHRTNEVVVTDQNLFQILIYDRLANSPAPDAITRPKRVIGGERTEIEFQSSVYVDPENGDVYAGNNDTVNKLVIFARDAEGDVHPKRELHTPDGRTFGLGVHEAKGEMYLVIQRDDAVVVYPKTAKDHDAPLRLLQGERTRLADPHDIVLDVEGGEIFVSNYGARTIRDLTKPDKVPQAPFRTILPGSGRFDPPSITVYRMDATGNAPPLRVIQGPRTGLNWGTGLALDTARNEIYVANDMGDEVLVFDSEADGDVAPKRVLKGPRSGIKNPMDVYLDAKHDELWVTNFGNHSVSVYRRDAAGDTPPLRVIRGGPAGAAAPMMGNPHPVAYDSIRDQILVPN